MVIRRHPEQLGPTDRRDGYSRQKLKPGLCCKQQQKGGCTKLYGLLVSWGEIRGWCSQHPCKSYLSLMWGRTPYLRGILGQWGCELWGFISSNGRWNKGWRREWNNRIQPSDPTLNVSCLWAGVRRKKPTLLTVVCKNDHSVNPSDPASCLRKWAIVNAEARRLGWAYRDCFPSIYLVTCGLGASWVGSYVLGFNGPKGLFFLEFVRAPFYQCCHLQH